MQCWKFLLQMPDVEEERFPLMHLLRGRLVLALQYWLWRVQAWMHGPSWDVAPEGLVLLPDQEDNLRILCEALQMKDKELMEACSLFIVVRRILPYGCQQQNVCYIMCRV